MKRAFYILLTVTILFSFSACQTSRTPITVSEFTAKAEAAGYTVYSINEQYPDEDLIDYILARKGEDEVQHQIEFIVFKTAEEAINLYGQNKAAFESEITGVSSYASVTLGNYAYYVLTNNGRYRVISRIDNTYIYIDAEEQYKTEISDFLKTIGY